MNKIDAMKAKREKVLARAEAIRSVPGSGYHDNDPLGPVKHPDPVGRRDARLEHHVVAIREPFETWFVSDDAERVLGIMKEFYRENEPLLLQSRLDQSARALIETAKEYAEQPLANGCFVCRNAQFNDLLAIIHFADVGVTGVRLDNQ